MKDGFAVLDENGGRDLEYSVILDNIESLDERSGEACMAENEYVLFLSKE